MNCEILKVTLKKNCLKPKNASKDGGYLFEEFKITKNN